MLPRTWVDRVLAMGTVVAAVILVGFAVADWEELRTQRYLVRGHTETRSAPVSARPSAGHAAKSRGSILQRLQVRQRTTAAPRPVLAAPPELEITAVRGPSWLEVRTSSSDGKQLFYGTLSEGDTESFRPLPVWVRVGALENLDLRLAGRRLGRLPAAPGGVAEFVVSRAGVAGP